MKDDEKRALTRLVDAAEEVLRMDLLQIIANKKQFNFRYLQETVAEAKALLGQKENLPCKSENSSSQPSLLG